MSYREMGIDILPRPYPRTAILGLLAFSACAQLPELDPLLLDAGAQVPTMAGATLGKKESRTLLANKSDGGELLANHIAVAEAVTKNPLTAGNEATLLYDGPATYRAMFKAIENAKDHINLEFYIIEDDEIGQRFADLLIKKQNEDVQVNLIYDGIGSAATSEAFFARLKEAGINILEFNPVNPAEGLDLNHRDHRKIVVVDGKLAFTGGINISGVYSQGSSVGSANKDAKKPGWRDTQIEIAGPAAAEFQELFISTWRKEKGPPLVERNYFPDVKGAGNDLVRVLGSSPDKPLPTIYLTLLSAIAHAQKTVYITMGYFVPDRQTMDALKAAAKRGVEVALILPSYSDFWAVFHAGRANYDELLESGVVIYERQDTLLHSKTIVIDGVWSTVGSSNLDWRSFLHNDEVNAVVLDEEFGEEMEAMFARDLAQSRQIKLDEWKDRGVTLRVKEWAAQIWEYWL
ncbi:MAG: cardiolipin synthase [Burkholderiales bacterium]